MTAAGTGQEQLPWHAEFPAPRNTSPESVSRDIFAEMLLGRNDGDKKVAGRDFLLVDVRRNDHEGGTIRGSLNLPAQSLYHSLPTLYNLCDAAKIPLVIFYCGSSGGRGTRAAGWFDDYIKSKGNSNMKSVILAGGIKGWASAGRQYEELMDGYVREVWHK